VYRYCIVSNTDIGGLIMETKQKMSPHLLARIDAIGLLYAYERTKQGALSAHAARIKKCMDTLNLTLEDAARYVVLGLIKNRKRRGIANSFTNAIEQLEDLQVESRRIKPYTEVVNLLNNRISCSRRHYQDSVQYHADRIERINHSGDTVYMDKNREVTKVVTETPRAKKEHNSGKVIGELYVRADSKLFEPLDYSNIEKFKNVDAHLRAYFADYCSRLSRTMQATVKVADRPIFLVN